MIRGGEPDDRPRSNGKGSGMVALKGVIYGVSAEIVNGGAAGLTMWRSEDGSTWRLSSLK